MNKEEREALWRERLKAQRESGLSVPAWCNREGLCESHMYRWRRPLRERGEWAPALIAVPMPKVEVAVVPLEMQAPNGYVIRLASLTQLGLLRELLTEISGQTRSG